MRQTLFETGQLRRTEEQKNKRKMISGDKSEKNTAPLSRKKTRMWRFVSAAIILFTLRFFSSVGQRQEHVVHVAVSKLKIDNVRFVCFKQL